MANRIASFMKDESGSTAVEYSLLVALISIATMAVMSELGQKLVGVFTRLGDTLAIVAAHN